MKQCFKCKELKVITEFYRHAGMADGHLNKCKECNKSDVKKQYRKRSESYQYIEQERARGGDKDAVIKRYSARFPEKRKAYGSTNYKTRKYKGNHLHHWSYRECHIKDTIELRACYHTLIHRYLVYDQEFKYYRSLSGILLDTKNVHYQYLLKIIKLYHQNQLQWMYKTQ